VFSAACGAGLPSLRRTTGFGRFEAEVGSPAPCGPGREDPGQLSGESSRGSWGRMEIGDPARCFLHSEWAGEPEGPSWTTRTVHMRSDIESGAERKEGLAIGALAAVPGVRLNRVLVLVVEGSRALGVRRQCGRGAGGVNRRGVSASLWVPEVSSGPVTAGMGPGSRPVVQQLNENSFLWRGVACAIMDPAPTPLAQAPPHCAFPYDKPRLGFGLLLQGRFVSLVARRGAAGTLFTKCFC
jgi:hypothetical protein